MKAKSQYLSGLFRSWGHMLRIHDEQATIPWKNQEGHQRRYIREASQDQEERYPRRLVCGMS